MSRIIAILLLFCLGCQLVLKLSIITWFEINQDYIAATFCENKSRPELVCCGKCVLYKKLDKATQLEKGDSDKSTNSSTDKSVKADKSQSTIFIIPSNNITTHSVFFSIEQIFIPRNSHHYGILFSEKIFHPPSKLYS